MIGVEPCRAAEPTRKTSTLAVSAPVKASSAWLSAGLLLVALSDLRRQVATPVEVIRREKFTIDATKLLALLTARGAFGIVLGLPLNMDGSVGPRVQATQAFARNLEKLTALPICYWDERLSTVAAERALLEADTSRKRRKEVIDQVAAGYILQGALDRMAHLAKD